MVVSHPRMSGPLGQWPMQGGVFGMYWGRKGLTSAPAEVAALMIGFLTALKRAIVTGLRVRIEAALELLQLSQQPEVLLLVLGEIGQQISLHEQPAVASALLR